MGVLDFIFPKICLGCGREGAYLCKICVEGAPRAKAICPYCRNLSINGMTHFHCQRELGLDGLTSIWEHKGSIRKAILALKYKYATEIGRELSEHITNSLSGLAMPPVQNLVPIPIYWYKQNVRGFNQSIEVGGNIAEKMRLKFDADLLIKKVSTVPQAGLSREARQKNVRGTFAMNPDHKILDSSYLLFDDVFTTGTTMFEAAEVLKRSGVKKVWGLTIAR